MELQASDQVGLRLKDALISASQELGIKVCATMCQGRIFDVTIVMASKIFHFFVSVICVCVYYICAMYCGPFSHGVGLTGQSDWPGRVR